MGRSLPKGWRHRPSPPAWPGGEPKLRPQNGTRPDLSRLLDRPLEACSAEASRSLYLSKRPLAPSSDRVTRPDEPSAGSQWWKALFLVLSIFFPPLQWRPWFSGVGKGRWLVFSIKHDLARSCFQLWPKIGDENDKISRNKTGEDLAETVFSRNLVTLGADFGP